MNKWPKIKNKIYHEKLSEVSGLFTEIAKNANDVKVPRSKWLSPLEDWTTRQTRRDTALRLSLQEFAHLKCIVDNLNNTFAANSGNENKTINEFQQIFLSNYSSILESKANELKLEVTAELIEEKQFPLDVFVDWYQQAYTLPPDIFNEELGEFWGDVWRHAAKGAGYGALAGGAAGGIPSGGMGTFAGAGLGGMAGGVAGGLYGGASNLLKRVWQYRQTQRNFEQTKHKAVDALKKLRDLSQGFEMHPNFIKSLESMIDNLGTVRAYRMAGATPSSETPKTVNPMKAPPHPGWAELGKSASVATPAPSAAPAPAPTTAPTAAPTAAPAPTGKRRQNLTPEQRKQKSINAYKFLHGKLPPGEEAPEASSPPEASPPTPSETAPAVEGTKFNSEEDILNFYNKAKQANNEDELIRLGNALDFVGTHHGIHPTDGLHLRNLDKPIDISHFNQSYEHVKNFAPDEEGKGHAKKLIDLYVKHLEEKKTEKDKAKEITGLSAPGTPKVMDTPEKPIAPTVLPDEELLSMDSKALWNYLKTNLKLADKMGANKQIEPNMVGKKDTAKRDQFIKAIKFMMGNPEEEETTATESATVRIKKIIHERKLAELPIKEKVEYLKSLLRV